MKLARRLAVFALLVGGANVADGAELALYPRLNPVPVKLSTGEVRNRLLSPEPPFGEEQRKVDAGIPKTDTAIVGEFASSAPQIDRIGLPPLRAVLYLAAHDTPMVSCAEVIVDVARVGRSPRAVLASGTVHTVTIPPTREGGFTDPIIVPLDVTEEGWELAPGDGLILTVRVQNNCPTYRGVVMFYDAVSQATRLVFADDPANRLGFVDNCPAVNNPDQLDSDGDGLGDACETPDLGNLCGVCRCACPDDATCGNLTPLEWVDVVACLSNRIRSLVNGAQPSELSRRVRRPGSALRRVLRREARALRALRAVLKRGGPATRVGRRLNRLERSLDRLALIFDRVYTRNLMSTDFHDQVAGFTASAQVAVGRARF